MREFRSFDRRCKLCQDYFPNKLIKYHICESCRERLRIEGLTVSDVEDTNYFVRKKINK